MTTCHLADVPKPRPELVALVTTKVINDVAALVAEVRIDHSYQCPYVAGVNQDCTVCYVGSDVPEMLSDGENEFHSDAGVAWHECGEWFFMNKLGLDYDDAHCLVTWLVEQPVVTQIMRLDFEGYQRAFDPYVVADEHERLINVAPDLFLGPYEDDEPELLVSIRRAQGIEGRLNRLEDRRDPYGIEVDKAADDEARDNRGRWTSSEEILQTAHQLKGQVASKLTAAGYHVFLPPNPNSLSEYIQVGNKSEFHEGIDVVGSVRVRFSNHEGYGADFDIRPDNGGKYSQDAQKITDRIIARLKENGVEPVNKVTKVAPLGSDIRAAGVAYVAPDGDVLFLRRGQDQDHPGEWCLPGGCVEGHEGFAQAAAREFQEETSGRVDPEELQEVAHVNQEGVDFVTFLARGEKFDPIVSDESSDAAWCSLISPPTPLHPGVASVMVQIAAAAGGSLDKAAADDEARDDRGRWSREEGSPIARTWAKTGDEKGLTTIFDPEKHGNPTVYHGLKPGFDRKGFAFVTRDQEGAAFHGDVTAYKIRPGAKVYADIESDVKHTGEQTLLTAKQNQSSGIVHFNDLILVKNVKKSDTVSTATNLVFYDQTSASNGGRRMPWNTNEDLPAGVRSSLPAEAQSVFREVANRVVASGASDVSAIRQAWTAVKNGWEKDDKGEWKRKTSSGSKIVKGSDAMGDISFFMPITKKEPQRDGSVIVTGYASTPTKDLDDEIISLDAVKKALPAYMEWRNVRAMHQPNAVGTAKEAHVDDVGLYLRARIVEPGAVNLVNEGVYQGFSIGGRKLAKTGDTVTDLELVEISIVDRPCNPDTRFAIAKGAKVINPRRIDLVRAIESIGREDQITLDRAEVGMIGSLLAKLGLGKTADVILPAAGRRPMPSAAGQVGEGADASKRDVSDAERAALADQGHAMPDGSFPIKGRGDLENAVQAFGRAKNKASVKRHIVRRAKDLGATDALPDGWSGSTGGDAGKAAGATDLAKFANLYTVSSMISLLGQLKYLEECCEDGGSMCCGVPSGGGDAIECSKEFTDKFGSLLVQFADMTAELLDLAISNMKEEEAEEARGAAGEAAKAARAAGLTKVWSDAAREAANAARSHGWTGKPSISSNHVIFNHSDHPDHAIVVSGSGHWSHVHGDDGVAEGTGGSSLKEHLKPEIYGPATMAYMDPPKQKESFARLATIAKAAGADRRPAESGGDALADLKSLFRISA